MVSPNSKSYEEVNYTIRPSKQVERKLFIEAFHHLREAGYNISDYTYVGLGSVFYVDFILFHKYVYINKMICVEKSDIPKRMKFNQPYEFIDLKMQPFSDVLPGLNKQEKYIIWLDYDYGLNKDILDDLGNVAFFLRPGSILIVTVDAEPKIHQDPILKEELTKEKRDEYLLKFYTDAFGKHVGEIRKSDIAKNQLPHLFARVIRSQLETSMASREDEKFYQLFNFRYADGAQMLTIGGIIDLKNKEDELRRSGIFAKDYIQEEADPIEISVPPLTIREKQWLDSKDHPRLLSGELKPDFELDSNLLRNYLRYYKHYPTFYEIFL